MPPEEKAVQPEEMTFDAAFAEAVADVADAEMPDTLEPEQVAAPELAPAIEPAPEPEPEVEPEQVAAPEAASEPAPLTETSDNTDEVARLREELEALRREREEPAQTTEPQETPQEEALKPVLSEADSKKIEQYKEDWPDVAEAEELIRKQVLNELRTEIYTAVGTVLQQLVGTLGPALNEYQAVAINRRDAGVAAKHADYPVIKEKVKTWVNTQPAPVAAAYQQVLDNGSIDDVISVVSLYKQAVGQTAPQMTPTTTPQAAPALEVVPSGRRSAPVMSEPDKNDFQGGWAEALRS